LDRTVRLLEAALEEPELKLPRATALVEYHLRRNEVARKSHTKTWWAKHRGVKFLRLYHALWPLTLERSRSPDPPWFPGRNPLSQASGCR
jgi:hypothetical protein